MWLYFYSFIYLPLKCWQHISLTKCTWQAHPVPKGSFSLEILPALLTLHNTFMQRSYLMKWCLMARMQMMLKTCSSWKACLVNEKLETPNSCCYHCCFLSALRVSSFPLPQNELPSIHFPSSFYNVHHFLIRKASSLGDLCGSGHHT